nr:MAG TPA: hypothetical protein [Caudoviricetes sp.]
MKIRKYKNGTIKMTAENKRDSNNLMAFPWRVCWC